MQCVARVDAQAYSALVILVMTGHNEFLGVGHHQLSRFAARRGTITKSKKEYVMPCQVSSRTENQPPSKDSCTFRCMNLMSETWRKGVKLIVGTLPLRCLQASCRAGSAGMCSYTR